MGNVVFTTTIAKIWLGADGILRVTIEGTVQLKDGLEIEDAIDKAILGEKRPSLVDISKLKGIDLNARRASSYSKIFESIKAVALLINSPLSRFLGNFVISMNKLPAPTQLFTSEDDALIWLKGFLPEGS
jgi:hypothetical protein